MTTRPAIVTRAEWGANESWRSGTPDYAPVKMAFVHHTDSGNDYTAAEAPAIVRGVYAYHTKSLHWSDVGYNFLDRPLRHHLRRPLRRRHQGRHRRPGARLQHGEHGRLGDRHVHRAPRPRRRAVTALERLLAWKLDVHHVDPQGTGTLTCGYGQKFATGQRVTFPAIAGHRDANYTDCPGGRLYAQLPDVRKVVARIGQPKIYGFIVGDPSISPNGDGVRDKTTIGFTVSQTATWTVEIRDDAGRLVRHITGEGTVVETTWAGHDDDGKPLPDGVYTLRADATSADGEARSATADLRLDTVPPRVESAAIAPDPFSPNGDGQDDVATLTFVPGESGTARVSVIAADGTVLRRVTGWKAVSASAQHGPVGRADLVGVGTRAGAEGAAILLVELRDGAGNRDERAAHGDGGPDAGAHVGVAQDVLAQRRRRARRGHAVVQADAGGGRDRHGRPLGIHGADHAARQAGRPERGRWRGTASSAAAARPRAARTRSASRRTARSA